MLVDTKLYKTSTFVGAIVNALKKDLLSMHEPH